MLKYIHFRQQYLLLGMAFVTFVTVALALSSSKSPPAQTPLVNGSQIDKAASPVSKLTSYAWVFNRGNGPLSEGYRYTFSEDGNFRWNVVGDYIGVRYGSWSFRSLS